MDYFTSDTHYFHKNIIEYCNRPFNTVEDMNEYLIEQHNARVKPEDTLYHLGDFCFGGVQKWNSILDRLQGKIVLVKGNHDWKNLKSPEVAKRFHELRDDTVVASRDNNGRFWNIWLNHFPPRDSSCDPRELWRPDKSHWHELALCGHVHLEWKHYGGVINIGADYWDYQPVTLDEILEYRRSLTVLD